MRGGRLAGTAAVVLLLAGAIALQITRDRLYPRESEVQERLLYVRSGAALKRIAVAFDALLSDVYWIRALQHYGGERLTRDRGPNYRLLQPLLDLTTDLDPYFTIAYRFGAIFLSEEYPGGPGRPDQAVALLRKGIAAQPEKWQYYHDVAFVHYWHSEDYQAAAEWFQRASRLPGAPNWLPPMAASVLSAGRDRRAARFLWSQILQSEEEWLRQTATRSLMQLDALDLIDQLQAIVRRFPPPSGTPYSWESLVKRGVLSDVPQDPTGVPFEIDPASGDVSIGRDSRLLPLPPAMQR